MIIEEGPRNVGKTFLIDSIQNDRYYQMSFKLSFFNDYMKEYNKGYITDKIKSSKDMDFGYSIGKDLMLTKLFLQDLLSQSLIVDRGYVSTCVYSEILERVPYIQISNHRYNISKLIRDTKIKIIFIYGRNPEKRTKDEMDGLSYEKQLKTYKRYEMLLKQDGIYPIYFENKFDDQSVTDFKNLINSLLEDIYQ